MKYKCETCEKVFAQKGHYETHKMRKRPCVKKTDGGSGVEVGNGVGVERADLERRGETSGHDAAERPVHEPADIGGELLRLRPRQQGAEPEPVQEAPLRDPAPLVHQDAVHHGDLPGRPAEGERRHPQPDWDGLGQRRGGGRRAQALRGSPVSIRRAQW